MNADNSFTTSKTRNSSIELLRILAMVAIIFFHFHARNFRLYVFGNERILEEGLFLHTILLHIGLLGVPCFMFISGYYGMKFKTNRMIDITMQCFFYAMLSFIGISMANGYLTGTEQVFFFNNWWFIMSYVILYVFSKGINNIIEDLPSQKLLFLISFLYFILIGSLFNKSATVSGTILLLAFYLVARYVKLYLTEKQKTILIWAALGIAILHLLGIWISFKTVHLGALPYLGSYNNPLNILCVGGLVVATERIHFSSKIINYLASSSLATYLFSESLWGQKLFQGFYATIEGLHYGIVYLVMSIIIFLICVMIDKLRIIFIMPLIYHTKLIDK